MSLSLNGKVVLITGASRGIGRASAIAFAEEGAHLVIAGRSKGDLEETAKLAQRPGIRILHAPADLTDRDQVKTMFQKIKDGFGRIDILINNAGSGMNGGVDSLNSEKLEYLFRLNFFAPLWCIQEALPMMRAQDSGQIISISSIAGKRGFPFDGGYCASKFALSGLVESLRVELMDTNIRVILVCPSGTETSFFERSIKAGSGGYMLPVGKLMKPEKVARYILRASLKGSREVVPGFKGKALILLNKLSPNLVDRLFASRLGIKR